MTERTLFDGPEPRELARRSDPGTSHEAAAEHVASGNNAAQRLAVLQWVRFAPGRTSDELAHLMGVSRHVTGRRLPDLERQGLVRRGEPRVSKVGGRRGLTWWPVDAEGAF